MQTDSIIFQTEMCIKTRSSNIATLTWSTYFASATQGDDPQDKRAMLVNATLILGYFFYTVQTPEVKFLIERDVKCTHLAIAGQVSSKVTAEINCIVIRLIVLDRPELFTS